MVKERIQEEDQLWEWEYRKAQRSGKSLPPSYQPKPTPPQPPIQCPAQSSLPPPAVEQAFSDQELEKLAVEILIRLSKVEPSERETTWRSVQTGLKAKFPDLIASELIRRIKELEKLAR